jgi:hypothetical protein
MSEYQEKIVTALKNGSRLFITDELAELRDGRWPFHKSKKVRIDSANKVRTAFSGHLIFVIGDGVTGYYWSKTHIPTNNRRTEEEFEFPWIEFL